MHNQAINDQIKYNSSAAIHIKYMIMIDDIILLYVLKLVRVVVTLLNIKSRVCVLFPLLLRYASIIIM